MQDSVPWGRVAYTLAAFSNETRLRTLLGIRAEQSFEDIAAAADVSENAVRLQVQELEDRELVYRDQEAAYRFQLTPIGQYLAGLLADQGPVIAKAVGYVEEAAAEAREENAHLSGEVFEQAVEQRKWALVSEELQELLESQGQQ